MFVTREALNKLGMPVQGARVVIQGFGNVGGMAARLMSRAGFKIVSIVEWDGAVYNPHGLDIDRLMAHRRETGSIRGFNEAEDMDKDEALLMSCDVLIPAARENVITSANADRIKAKILCEGANGPTTFVADSILSEKKVFVIPDILANAGGVTVSYFEWVQDRQGYFWSEKRVNEQLEEIMVASFQDVTDYATRHNVNNRTAAYMLALDRVANAIRKRGLYA
jgi:glutamate dehydrogenase (NAD(P)+)